MNSDQRRRLSRLIGTPVQITKLDGFDTAIPIAAGTLIAWDLGSFGVERVLLAGGIVIALDPQPPFYERLNVEPVTE